MKPEEEGEFINVPAPAGNDQPERIERLLVLAALGYVPVFGELVEATYAPTRRAHLGVGEADNRNILAPACWRLSQRCHLQRSGQPRLADLFGTILFPFVQSGDHVAGRRGGKQPPDSVGTDQLTSTSFWLVHCDFRANEIW
jgi:hypothetical protein